MEIRKTVIGSFPKLPRQVSEAIKEVIKIQLSKGLEIISDGEQRADMITYFEQIPGLVRSTRGLAIRSRILPPEDPSGIVKVTDFLFARDYLRNIGREGVIVKTALTGPITLGVTCATSGLQQYSSLNDLNLYYDLSRALEPIVVELLRLGSFVQIDEPGLSAGYMAPSKAVSILRELFEHANGSERCPGSLSMHVCGNLERVPGLLQELLGLDLDVISLAFSGRIEKSNLNLISESLFKDSGKKLGVGCASVTALQQDQVEDADRIYQRIRNVADKVGERNLAYAHPDCGLRGVPLEVSELILHRLSEAVTRYDSDS